MARPSDPARRRIARQAGVTQYRGGQQTGLARSETPEEVAARLRRTAPARERAKRYPQMATFRHTKNDGTVVRMAPGGRFPVDFDAIVSVRRFNAAAGPTGPYSRWFRNYRNTKPTHADLVTRVRDEWYAYAVAHQNHDIAATRRHYHQLRVLLTAAIPPEMAGDDAFWRRIFGSP